MPNNEQNLGNNVTIGKKRERIIWILAYAATLILTLLPFFQIGFTNNDDFQYYNSAQDTWKDWLKNHDAYAHNAGRFYFLITKFFYYVPYLVDNFVYTKFIQYISLIVCYLIFTYLIYRIFKSWRMGALTLLLLIFNTNMGYYVGFNPPTAYPFYFPFSFIIFISGIIIFINYTEEGGYWRVLLSSVLFFISCLFYENYLVFTLLFGCYIIIRNGQRFGFLRLWKNKMFYKEALPFATALMLYVVCYYGYRYYIVHVLGITTLYSGTTVGDINMANFFTLINDLTFYNLPGKIYLFGGTRTLLRDNSQLIIGHDNSIWFMLTHASPIIYINAFLQFIILWFIIHKSDFEKISWKAIFVGMITAIVFALSANVLIAITEKYNSEWAGWIKAYVTSFFSYFGVMVAIALLMVAILKLLHTRILHSIACAICCIALFGFSVFNQYINEHLGRAWGKSQTRFTLLQYIHNEGFFDKIPEKSLIYTEQLLHTSDHISSICDDTDNFDKLIMRYAHQKEYHFAYNIKDLQNLSAKFPDAPIYFIQTTGTKKYNELMMVFSHISHFDTLQCTADTADIFYYSPTKEYLLMYGTNAQTDSACMKAVTVISCNKHRRATHVALQEDGLNPLGFNISNIIIPTTDTLWLP